MFLPKSRRLLLSYATHIAQTKKVKKTASEQVIHAGNVAAAILKIGSATSIALGTALLVIYTKAEGASLPTIEASGYGAALGVFVGVLCFISLSLAAFLFAPTFVSSWARSTLPEPTSFWRAIRAYTATFLPFILGELALVGFFLLPEDRAISILQRAAVVSLLFIYVRACVLLADDINSSLRGWPRFEKFVELTFTQLGVNAISFLWSTILFAATLAISENIESISKIDAGAGLTAIYVGLTVLHFLMGLLQIDIKRAFIGVSAVALMLVLQFPGPAIMTAIALRAAGIGGGQYMELFDRTSNTVEPICLLVRLGSGISYRPNPEGKPCSLPFTSLTQPSDQAKYRASQLPASIRDLQRGVTSLGQPGAFSGYCPEDSGKNSAWARKCYN